MDRSIVPPHPILTIFLLVLLASCGGCSTPKPTDEIVGSRPPTSIEVGKLMDQSRPPKSAATRYDAPTLKQRVVLKPAMLDFMNALSKGRTPSPETIQTIESTGFKVHALRHRTEEWYLLAEKDEWTGRGGYLFRSGKADDLILQTPHTYFDIGTGDVGIEVFKRTKARALFFNTAHRYSAKSEFTKGATPADLAHRSDTFFYFFTALYTQLARQTVVQIHGFSTKNKKKFDIIVSDGTDKPSESTVRFQSALAEDFRSVGLYPKTTKRLGATSNPLGRWLRRQDLGEFLHLEASEKVRRQWAKDPATLVRAIEVATALPVPEDANEDDEDGN